MKRITFLLIALLVPILAIAADKIECPNLEANKDQLRLESEYSIVPDSLYMYSGREYLNDNQLWSFEIGPVQGNWSEGRKEAHKIIKSITSPGIVKYSKDWEQYYCSYPTGIDNMFIILTVYTFDDI